MVVCRKCSKEMECITNGVQVRFGNGSHVYAGDEFICRHCNDSVIVTNRLPHVDSEILDKIDKNEHIDRMDNKTNIWMM